MDDLPLEVNVEVVDGWIVVITATGAWELAGRVLSQVIHPVVQDEANRWFLVDLTAVTFGSEEMVGGIWQVVRAARRRGGGLVICCQDKIGRVVNIAFGGTLHLCDTLEGARRLLESMRGGSETAGCGPQTPPERVS